MNKEEEGANERQRKILGLSKIILQYLVQFHLDGQFYHTLRHEMFNKALMYIFQPLMTKSASYLLIKIVNKSAMF